MAKQTIAKLTNSIAYRIDDATAALAKWKESFEQNPHYAFTWSDRAVQAAADLQVFTRAKLTLDHMVANGTGTEDEQLAKFAESVLQDVVRRAGNTSRSTSAASNAVEDAERVAASELLRLANNRAF